MVSFQDVTQLFFAARKATLLHGLKRRTPTTTLRLSGEHIEEPQRLPKSGATRKKEDLASIGGVHSIYPASNLPPPFPRFVTRQPRRIRV